MASLARTLLWLTLGFWFGGMGLFAFVVSPAVFSSLSVAQASAVISPVLDFLNYYGIAAGLLLGGLALALGRSSWLVALPVALALLCAISQFGLTAAMADVLPHKLGPDSAPDASERFRNLHRWSLFLFSLVLLGVIALFALHSRADAQAARDTSAP